MDNGNTTIFFEHLNNSLLNKEFIKITVSDKRVKEAELKNVSAKVVSLKTGTKLSFVYRYPTKDITKNLEFEEALVTLKDMLQNEFLRADLFTIKNDYHLVIDKINNISAIKIKPPSNSEVPELTHDKIKFRPIGTTDKKYLFELGITTSDGKVKADKNDKYKQINKYIEIMDGIIKSAELNENITVSDMGSGKGYLTFALYDYLSNTLNLKPVVTGVEFREELVEKCNSIAKNSGFRNLSFIKGSIETTDFPESDILIALHACDTATDEAIFRGIKSKAKIIICAPCCHKQIRKQTKPENILNTVTRHGILEERISEIVTDSIRSLILEAYGYKTKVFEFISTEHTPKNLLIVGIKEKNNTEINQKSLEQIKELKSLFGIQFHYLEKLMGL
jgi:SAM-dependent methyltransferase